MRRMNDHAQMAMVGQAVGLLITLIIVVLVYYNIAGSTHHTTNYAGETTYQSSIWNASNNATGAVNTQAATFFTIAPIIVLVIVAVVVISYVKMIG